MLLEALPTATVPRLCDLFLDWCQKHNFGHQEYLQNFCEAVGNLNAAELKPFHVTRWLDQRPKWKGSRRGAIIVLKWVFNWACDEGFIENNPIRKLKKPAAKIKAGQQDEFPRALLARAELHIVTNKFLEAEKVILKAREIAIRCELALQTADCHLKMARLHARRAPRVPEAGHLELGLQERRIAGEIVEKRDTKDERAK